MKKIIACIVTIFTIALMTVSVFAADDVKISLVSQDAESGKTVVSILAEAGETVTLYKTIAGETVTVGSVTSDGTAKNITLIFTQLSCGSNTDVAIYAENELGAKSETLHIKAHGPHDKSDNWTTITAASCTGNGEAAKKCTKCGTVLETKELVGSGHSWNEPVWTWTKDYTSCTATFTCKKDSSHTNSITTQAVSISKTVEPTCISAGSKTYTAAVTFNNKVYNVSKTVTVSKLNHELSDWTVTVEPTCTTAGTRVKKCTACRDIIATEQVPATGHNWVIEYKWSSDSETCSATATCTHNKAHAQTETVKGLDKINVAATCQKNGKMTRTATFTNSLFKAQSKTASIIGSHVDADKDNKCDVCRMNLKTSETTTEETTTAGRSFFEGLFKKEEDETKSETFNTTAPEEMVTSFSFDEPTEVTTVNKNSTSEKHKVPTTLIIVLTAIGVSIAAAIGGIVMLVREDKPRKKKRKKVKKVSENKQQGEGAITNEEKEKDKTEDYRF